MVTDTDESIHVAPHRAQEKAECKRLGPWLPLAADYSSVLVENEHDLRKEQRLDEITENLRPKQVTVQDVDFLPANDVSQLPEGCYREARSRGVHANVRVLDLYRTFHGSKPIDVIRTK